MMVVQEAVLRSNREEGQRDDSDHPIPALYFPVLRYEEGDVPE